MKMAGVDSRVLFVSRPMKEAGIGIACSAGSGRSGQCPPTLPLGTILIAPEHTRVGAACLSVVPVFGELSSEAWPGECAHIMDKV